ncbi:protein yeeZ [Catenovulum agarivorans DS-2]|uniref:Protein yeeZ n=1 Tax=Catenovulum agarivorans DS-2 TaxID=1328313 RepID=W7QQG1_9ALTE|nr:NAD(P)H-binding protein [Catenovulum agarivorans]EWH10128.1 protein yeeZ [Catenovulum agarivorans DS-2]
MNISIIGAGWVGLPLAQLLTSGGHQVKVSRSSNQGIESLLQHGMDAKKVQLDQGEVVEADVVNLIELGQADCVVITIPPGFRAGNGHYYPQHIKALCQHIAPTVKQVILTSSTAVYPEVDRDLSEYDAAAWNEKAQLILQAEDEVRACFPAQYLIVRFSGLFGCGRHPARFVKHMRSLSSRSYANMLHQKDAVHGLEFLINQQICKEAFNLSTPEKISKAEFYKLAIANYSAETPACLPSLVDSGAQKFVLSDKIKTLGYQFKFSQIKDALAHC